MPAQHLLCVQQWYQMQQQQGQHWLAGHVHQAGQQAAATQQLRDMEGMGAAPAHGSSPESSLSAHQAPPHPGAAPSLPMAPPAAATGRRRSSHLGNTGRGSGESSVVPEPHANGGGWAGEEGGEAEGIPAASGHAGHAKIKPGAKAHAAAHDHAHSAHAFKYIVQVGGWGPPFLPAPAIAGAYFLILPVCLHHLPCQMNETPARSHFDTARALGRAQVASGAWRAQVGHNEAGLQRKYYGVYRRTAQAAAADADK